MKCTLCPRRCGVDRAHGAYGFCQSPALPRVARAALHHFEEPPISGTRGSGTVFFTGCPLGCVFCQNKSIRSAETGEEKGPEELAALFLSVQEAGAHNINLVTPTHFADTVEQALRLVRPHLSVPVVYNCGGYERVETLSRLSGLVDIYLPDFKYISPALSLAYSAAADYGEVASAALSEMWRQVGAVRFDGEGLMTRGVLVRHLVLPGARKDSLAVLDRVASLLPVEGVRLSLMSQYTPAFAPPDAPAPLHRRVTCFEYESVLEHALALGFEGYYQGRSSASADYTPDFTDRGLLSDTPLRDFSEKS